MSSTNQNFKTAIISFVVSLVVLALKTKAYLTTGSVAVLSDALETVINVITAVVALYAVKLAAEPADEGHPYGHGKMEYFSAAFEGGLIFFAALAILFKSVESFFVPFQITNIQSGFNYLLLATLLNLITGLYLLWTGKKQKSEALKASGQHILSDVITSVGVVVGLFLVQITRILWVDSVVGLLVGFWLAYEAYKIMRSNTGALLDEMDDQILEKLSCSIEKFRVPGVIDIHHVRMIRSGPFHHIDAHMVVPEFWNVQQAHLMAHEFEKNVVRDYEYDGEFAFHMDPCQKLYCQVCAVENCQIRTAPFQEKRYLTKEHLIKGPQYTNAHV